MNEPKVPRYSQHISQLCLRLKITAWSANEALASAMSFMPNQASSDASDDERHPDEAGVLQPHLRGLAVLDDGLRDRRRAMPNTPTVMTSGTRNCTDRHAQVAQPGVDAERRALALLREEEADVGHARGEVAAAQAAQQREHQHASGSSSWVLHREADADAPGSAATRWRSRSSAGRRRSAP